MKKILTTCTALLAVLSLFAQSSAGFWSENHSSNFTQPAFMPTEWRALSLNMDAMRNHLRQAPMEFTSAAQNAPLALALPMPDGTMAEFNIWESPIMEPALAAKFPMIKTYAGKAVLHPETSIRLDFSPEGFNAIIHEGGSTLLIVPNSAQEQVYLSFYLKNVDLNSPNAQQFHCEVEHTQAEIESFTEDFGLVTERAAVPVDLFTYRLALATTVEYSSSEGNTPASVMAAVTTVVNNINSVFERDAAVRVIMIANTDMAFNFTNPDPYTNGNTEMMISQNPAYLNGLFTVSGYDIGHVFGTNGGGLASLGGVCNSDAGIANFPKARAASCKFGPYTGPLFYIVAGHEMGHQFNATHTFNKCDDMNETPETAYEPGSGSTIMCYNGNGVCTVNHLQPTTDDYFHNNSMVRMEAYTRTGEGFQCKQVVAGGNTKPEASIPMQGGFYIPKSTPFSLTGTASDIEDPNTLTYCWEQYDLGPASILGMPTGTSPLFRSYPPKTTPTRIFPKLQTILNNTTDIQELLPTIDRVLTFRFTVRDNHPNAGAFNYDEIQFNCDDDSGPFVETYPNGGETFTVGDYVEVTWDVANTNNVPVNCKKVNLYLSTDGGLTYPTMMVSQVENDGSAYVVMPNSPSTTARIKVEAADNIFFDISNANFTIEAATQPSYLLTSNPPEGGLACDEFLLTLQTQAVLGYNGDVSFTVNGLPAGVTANFSNNIVATGQSTTLTINTSGSTIYGPTTFSVVGSSAGLTDQTRTFTINIVDTDLSGITATTPADGAAGQATLPVFTWSSLPNADSYNIQIATDPGFTTIVDSGTGLTSTQFNPSITLDDNQTYYWRVQASNLCGTGDFGDPFSFRTVSQACTQVTSSGDQNNIPISSTGLPTITSKVNIAQGGTISDVNVKKVTVTHSSLRRIEIRLKSPAGTSVVLMSKPNCNSNSLNSGFDDQSANTLTACPTANLTYKPIGPLSTFNGENSQGQWTLEVAVVDDGDGGTFSNWTLEVCGSSTSASPIIVKNDTLGVPPGGTNRIYTNSLVVNDADNTWSDLKFTIVKNTASGQVKLNGQTLGVGGNFTMNDVFNNYLTYTNTNSAALFDYFTFSVDDGEGGFAGTPRFNIKMDAGADIIGGTNGNGQADDARFQIFPNPATSEANLVLAPQLGKPLAVQMLDVQGRIVPVSVSGLETGFAKLNTTNVVAGLYFVQVRTSAGVFIKKLVIE